MCVIISSCIFLEHSCTCVQIKPKEISSAVSVCIDYAIFINSRLRDRKDCRFSAISKQWPSFFEFKMSFSLFGNKSTGEETKSAFVSWKVRYTHKKGISLFNVICHEYGAGDFLFYLFGREYGEFFLNLLVHRI